jgi:hypothetical protein
MSTVAEIEAALRELSTAELQRIESALRKQFNEREDGQPHLIRSRRLAPPDQSLNFNKTLIQSLHGRFAGGQGVARLLEERARDRAKEDHKFHRRKNG